MKSILLSSSSNVGRCITWCWKLRERNIALYERFQVSVADAIVQLKSCESIHYDIKKKGFFILPLKDSYVDPCTYIGIKVRGMYLDRERADRSQCHPGIGVD